MPLRKQAVNIGSLLFPRVRIHKPHAYEGSYIMFLGSFKASKGYRKTLAVLDKSQIDSEFEKQVKDLVGDESVVERYMKEGVQSKRAEKHFSGLQRHVSGEVKPMVVAEEVKSLDLPAIGNHPKNRVYDIYDRQSYADFASKAEKKNPSFNFSKSKMDQAFEFVAERSRGRIGVGAAGHQRERHGRMMSRCLGKESDEYWKDR